MLFPKLDLSVVCSPSSVINVANLFLKDEMKANVNVNVELSTQKINCEHVLMISTAVQCVCQNHPLGSPPLRTKSLSTLQELIPTPSPSVMCTQLENTIKIHSPSYVDYFSWISVR